MFIDPSKAYVPSFISEVGQIVADKIWQYVERELNVTKIALVHAEATSELLKEFGVPSLTELKVGSEGLEGVAEYSRCFELRLVSWSRGCLTLIYIDKGGPDFDPQALRVLQRLALESELGQLQYSSDISST